MTATKGKYVFIDVDNKNEELDHLPPGKYRIFGEAELEVTFDVVEGWEYTFKYRIREID